MLSEKVNSRSLGIGDGSDTEGKNEREMGRKDEQKSQETWGKVKQVTMLGLKHNSGCSWSRVKSRIETVKKSMPQSQWFSWGDTLIPHRLLWDDTCSCYPRPCYTMLFCRVGALQLTSDSSVPYALTHRSATFECMTSMKEMRCHRSILRNIVHGLACEEAAWERSWTCTSEEGWSGKSFKQCKVSSRSSKHGKVWEGRKGHSWEEVEDTIANSWWVTGGQEVRCGLPSQPSQLCMPARMHAIAWLLLTHRHSEFG